jgi:hypothetical protein
MTAFREFVMRVEWGSADIPFRLERQTRSNQATATLTTPDGQVLDLDSESWQNIAIAVNRIFAQTALKLAVSAPANAGKPWTRELDDELTKYWNSGNGIAALAKRFQRTRGSITSRLLRLGLIQDPDADPKPKHVPDAKTPTQHQGT